MVLKKLLIVAWTLSALAVIPVLLAQEVECSALVQQALENTQELCGPASRNQACYGNDNLQAEPQPDVSSFQFDAVGDIVDVNTLQTLRTLPLDPANNQWGVALLRLQANLPNTLPGQNVTFLIFGDTQIESAVTEGKRYTPMQAFVLRTGLTGNLCEQAPESGLLVQTPQGVGQVKFNMNGVDVSMGSTVYFQATPGENMIVRTVEGKAFLKVNQRVVPILAGTQASFPVDDDLELIEDEPYTLERLDEDIAEDLPLDFLDEEIELDEPLTDEEFDAFLEWAESDDCAAFDFGGESVDLCAMDAEFDDFDAYLDSDEDDEFFDDADDEDYDGSEFDDSEEFTDDEEYDDSEDFSDDDSQEFEDDSSDDE